MSRVAVPGLDLSPEKVSLPRDASHYLRRVLRLRRGDELTLLDGQGTVARGIISELSAQTVVVRIEERREEPSNEAPPLTLVQALPKGEKLDEIVRRATELGVTAIHPALAGRSVSRPDGKRAAGRVERWRRIAAEAARQCGRGDVPGVAPVLPLEEALEAGRGAGLAVAVWEGEKSTGLAERLRGEKVKLGATLVVGPEGGLSEEEVGAARALGYETASLGNRILRVETAAVAALAIAQLLLGALDPPTRAG